MHAHCCHRLGSTDLAQVKTTPGCGHGCHAVERRSAPLLARVDRAAQAGEVSGRHAATARAIEALLHARKGKPIPMNIDGATAVIYAELGFPPALARGLFCLSRSVGVLAHAWEQTEQGGRIKGPMPRQFLPTYEGRSEEHTSELQSLMRHSY